MAHLRADAAGQRLDPGLSYLALRWEDFFAWELHLGAHPRLEGLSEVVQQSTGEMQHEVWTATVRRGGACPPGTDHLHGERGAGQLREPQAGVPRPPRGAA